MTSQPSIVILVEGKELTRWTSFTLTKSMDELSHSFTATLTAPPDNFDVSDWWLIELGDNCEIYLLGQPAMYGWIEECQMNYNDNVHQITISGRDPLCDLVDCSHAPGALIGTALSRGRGGFGIISQEAYAPKRQDWIGISPALILKELCIPFNITVVIPDYLKETMDIPINEEFKTNEGDTIFDAISRICQFKGVIPLSSGFLELHIRREPTDRAVTPLKTGYNILEAASDESNVERFSNYVVKANQEGEDLLDVTSTAGSKGEATDSRITRYRPLIIMSDMSANDEECKIQAQWESVTRAGSMREITYVVTGWTQSDGTLWNINKLVEVDDSIFNFHSIPSASEETSVGYRSRSGGTDFIRSVTNPVISGFPVGSIIKAIKFSFDEKEGSLTYITITDSTAYYLFPDAGAIKGSKNADSEDLTGLLEEKRQELADALEEAEERTR